MAACDSQPNTTKTFILYNTFNNIQICKSKFSGYSIQVCMPDFMRKRLIKNITQIQAQASTQTPQELQLNLQLTLELVYRDFAVLRSITSTNKEHNVQLICINLSPEIIALLNLVYPPIYNLQYIICESQDDAISKFADYFELLSQSSSTSSSSASSPFQQQPQPIFDDHISTIPFPNTNGNLITDNQVIYLCGDSGANNFDKLSKLGITHIINVSDNIQNYYEGSSRIIYMRVPIADCSSVILKDYFSIVFNFINSALETGGRILIHCFAGISRSSSFVIAYLMHHYKMTYKVALQYVKSHRAVVEPNLGFELQLNAYEKSMY